MAESVDHVLEVRSVTKTFPGVRALSDVSLQVRRGEVHALVGENGAGKSTLVKILDGVYPAGTFAGELLLNGRPLRLRSPHGARACGIAYVPQEIAVIESLSVAENVYVGNWRRKPGVWVNFPDLYRRTEELFRQLNLREDPREPISSLPAGRRQLIMIARALCTSPFILILDEPTSSLTQDETDNLLSVVRNLQEQGARTNRPFTCIFISHRLEEVSAIADRVTVLRDGAVTATFERGGFTRDQIIAAMVGRKIENLYPARDYETRKEEMLRVENLTVPHPLLAGRNVVEGVSFSVRAGEILGLAGLVGSGRSEVVNALYGRSPYSGDIIIQGRRARIRNPRDAKTHGLALLTEERKRDGLLFNFAIRENITVNSLEKVSRLCLLRRNQETQVADGYMRKLAIRAPSVWTMVANLSGGNQQKTLLARAMMVQPKVLLLDEPTKGIDIGAKTEVYKLMADLAREGMALVVISSELPELLALCDRFVVLARGKITDEFPRAEASEERVMRAATGQRMNDES
ncbi:MAG: sugar ABC transporter ATP-binding protein [Planctomycetota bacterium]|nr:sugar ABC transporter ATP-binding protein [Planctomycetota bacterium]